MLNEVLENIKSRRSVRTYTEQQVSAENLNLIFWKRQRMLPAV